MDAARPAGPAEKGARCIIVTSNYHVFRTAILARKAGIRGQVTGARTAGYYWPSAMLREFAAVFLRYWAANLVICSTLVLAPVAYAVAGRVSAARRRPRTAPPTEITVRGDIHEDFFKFTIKFPSP